MALTKCNECGKDVSDQAAACPHCGAPVRTSAWQIQPSAAAPLMVAAPKSRSMAIFLAIFFGGIGLHKFYLNKPGQGVLYLVFCWTLLPLIFSIFEAFSYLLMSDAKFQQTYASAR